MFHKCYIGDGDLSVRGFNIYFFAIKITEYSILTILRFLCFSMAHKTRKPRVTSCHMTSYNSCGTEFYFPSSKNFPLMTFPINHLNNL